MSRDAGPDGQLGYWAGFRFTDWSQNVVLEADSPRFVTKTRDFVGWWALNPDPDDAHGAELGFRLRREHWRQGLAGEGALALLAHGFETVGLGHIWAQTMAVNLASRAVMERIGLDFERTWVGEWNEPLPGWEEGEVAYGVTRDQWPTRLGGGPPTPED